ncbi:hypothetical protein CCACVL1_23932 [Corchorus capsularis]|uniref:CRAL-TRIO domain-containing protein n=1 Tax=Corchorus capsularis TaxID=210143 RepID=A0A1R3GRN9_COCAP|nr:hypothetical protein CCACVL1_23932 [Corchorus capsularis]
MEKSQELALTQMRKSVEKLGFSTEKYGDPTLMRFLIARSMDIEKAAKMFVQWLKWRSSMVPNGFIAESEVPDELEARKIFLQSSSKTGHPVLIVKSCKHFPPNDIPQFKTSFLLSFQRMVLACDNSYFPERLAKCYLLNMPRFFVSVWRMVCRFIDKPTQEKIVIVTNEDEKKCFVEEVGEEAVPVEYGGKAKLTAIQDVEVPPFEGCDIKSSKQPT